VKSQTQTPCSLRATVARIAYLRGIGKRLREVRLLGQIPVIDRRFRAAPLYRPMNAAMTSGYCSLPPALRLAAMSLFGRERKSHVGFARLGIIALGGAVLLSYGIFVNIDPADFGRHYLSRVLSVECQTQS
jgi:hypothetical protein